MRPPLLLVTGPPSAGKTTLALPLAARLGLPLIAKDTIKEAMGGVLGASTIAESRRLGSASIVAMYALAAAQLDVGVGAVIESPLLRGVSEHEVRPLVARSRAAIVHCQADPAILRARYDARAAAGGRHPVHNDTARVAAEDRYIARGEDPLDLDIPRLLVDTTAGCRPSFEELVSWTRAQVLA